MRCRAMAVAGVLALVASGCASGVQSLSFPKTPTTPQPPPSTPTLPGDLSSLAENPVPGGTTTTVPPIGPGHAALNGSVFGPNGPVAGATVEADRFVGDQMSATTAKTMADGSWTIGNILGGRFRVRAWQAPSLDLTTPQVVFLGSTQTLTMSLQLAAFKGPNVASSISPAAPIANQPSNLLVQVTNPTVGPDGVVRYPPQAGAKLTLVDGPNWTVSNKNPATTDANGNVLFQVSCMSPGPAPLSVAVGSQPPVPLQMPACNSAPAPTTTQPFFNPCPTTTVPSHGGRAKLTTTTTLSFGSCG